MPILAMRDLLGAIWALLYRASTQRLSAPQSNELIRLLDLLERGLEGDEVFTERALAISLAIRSSGLFDPESATPTEDFMERVDALRGRLNPASAL